MARGDMAARFSRREGLEPAAAHAPSPAVPMGGSSIEAQVTSARQGPRSLEAFRRRVDEMLAFDPAQVPHLLWTREVDGKLERGASIRLAELLLYAWGNARSSAHILQIGRDYAEAEGVCLDVETNTATAVTVRRSTRRTGRRMSHEEVLNTATAAGSVARRNAILACIPQLVWGRVLRQVEDLIAGDEALLPERRDALLQDIVGRGVPPERVLVALGVDSIGDIGRDLLVTLHGLVASLNDGGADLDELFPDPAPPSEAAEGFSISHVSAETGIPLSLTEPEAETEPDPAGSAAEPERAPEPHPEPVDPIKAWMDTFKADLAQAPSPDALDQLAADLPARLEGREAGLSLAARAAISRRRRELEQPPKSDRDETIPLFEEA